MQIINEQNEGNEEKDSLSRTSGNDGAFCNLDSAEAENNIEKLKNNADTGSADDLNTLGVTHFVRNTMFKDPKTAEYNGVQCVTSKDCAVSDLCIDVSQFPPLPKPRVRILQQETNFGVLLVLSFSVIFIGVTHGISMIVVGGVERNSALRFTLLLLIYCETGFAIVCLIGLLLGNPGVVMRSQINSFPIPRQCELWIQAYSDGNERVPDTLRPKVKYIGTANPDCTGDTFCVQCLVWRRLDISKSYFHCSICQRCVMDYDHHCSVFGRCIGGNWLRGNYKYFVGVIAMGVAGYLTSIVSLVWSLSLRYEPKIAIPVCLCVVGFSSFVFVGRICIGIGYACRSFGLSIIEIIRKGLSR